MACELAAKSKGRNNMKVENEPGANAGGPSVDSSSQILVDPICKMLVAPEAAAGSFEHKHQTFYFCSVHCLNKFKSNPDSFLSSVETVPQKIQLERIISERADAKFTCPMHPEISSDKPGNCPKCGMALEALQPTADNANSIELNDMQKRFWISLTFTLPIAFISMSDMGLGKPILAFLQPSILSATQLILATPVVVWAGAPFFKRGLESIKQRSLNMFTLVAIGVGVAYAYSVWTNFLRLRSTVSILKDRCLFFEKIANGVFVACSIPPIFNEGLPRWSKRLQVGSGILHNDRSNELRPALCNTKANRAAVILDVH